MKAIRSIAMVVSVTFSLMFAGNAFAVECKGKSSSACNASNSCSWVKGYKRSDGAKVSSFCRAKPGKSTAAKKKPVKKQAKAKKADATKKATAKKKTVKDTKKASKKKVKKKASKDKVKAGKDKKKKASKKKDKKKS